MSEAYRFELLQDPRVILFTTTDDYNVREHLPITNRIVVEYLEAEGEPIPVIINALKLSVGLDDVIAGATLVARGATAPYHHPKLKKLILVSTDKLLVLSYRGLNSPIFGSIDVKTCTTLDEALDFVRSLG